MVVDRAVRCSGLKRVLGEMTWDLGLSLVLLCLGDQ